MRYLDKKSGFILLSMIFWGIMGCSKMEDFGDRNVNPNYNVILIPYTDALLTSAQSTLIDGITTHFPEAALYSQYFMNNNYPEPSLYQTTNANWGNYYAVSMEDVQKIIDLNANAETAKHPNVMRGGSTANQLAISRIIKTYLFSVLTDRWGDVPYFQALTGNPNPVYDKQQDIYNDLFKELKSAKNQFDGGALKGDIIYNGNISKWKRLSNSIRMVLALRLSKIDAVKGRAEFTDALNDADGRIEANADNFSVVFPGSAYKNPYFTTAGEYGLSKTFADVLNGYSDPRRGVYGTLNAGTSDGIPYGVRKSTLDNFISTHPNYAKVGDAFRQENSTICLLNAAQVFLTRSEAAKLGWSNENIAVLYQNGIQASWQQYGLSTTGLNIYVSNPAVALDGPNDVAKINIQKWIAIYPNGMEAWSEWRRTGFPALLPAPDAVNASKKIPRRYAYPLAEPNLNAANYSAAVSRLAGGDTHDGRVWWDKP